jgi:transposase
LSIAFAERALTVVRVPHKAAAAAQTNQESHSSTDVLTLLSSLLDQGDKAAVITLVKQLISSHHRQLKEALLKKNQSTKNEGVSSEQLAFIFEQMQEAVEQDAQRADTNLKSASQNEASVEGQKAKNPRPQPPRRRPIPEHLELVVNNIAVPASQRQCQVCGGERVCIGHDETDVIDIIPAKAIRRRDRREKLACKTCESEIERAPLGDKVVEGGAYGSTLVADMVVSKYDDGMPLERQRQRYERIGLPLPSATMGDQIAWAADLLAPVARRLFDAVLESDNMHLDATSLPVLDRDSPRGIKTGALWGYVGVNVDNASGEQVAVAAYLYNSTAKKNGQRDDELGPEEVLALRRRRGKKNVVADASGLFDASFIVPGLVEIGCNMHARRYFQKALEAGDLRAALPIGAFKRIYDVEEAIGKSSPGERREKRQAHARPVYDELLSWCRTYQPNEPPKSLLGRAIGYLINHHVALMRFLDDGTLPLDNGIVERLHKRPAMGRRAYLFAGSDTGAERAAIAYTVLGTCRLLGLNPLAYLADVLPRLARGISIKNDLPELMPAAWQHAHR